ncbi:MAG: nucleotidyltransferase domain-containing protein [Sporichthyaceae bacterium]
MRVAFLGGSSARGDSTATSDLDIVVVLDGPPAPYRETQRHQGQVVELFVHTSDSLEYWWRRDAEGRRNTLADMCAHGVVLVDDGTAPRVQDRAARFLAAGPPPLGAAETALRRYVLTDALDDLAAAQDPDERDAVAAMVLGLIGELALLSRGHWLGRGKWLVRRVREADAPLDGRLSASFRRAVASGDTVDLLAVADEVLATVGGRLSEGYRSV